MNQHFKKEFILPSIATIVFYVLYFLNIHLQIQITQPEILYLEEYSLFSYQDIYPLTIQGIFIFLTTYLFLKQFSNTLFLPKNLFFTAILPAIYLLSHIFADILMGSLFHFVAKQSKVLTIIFDYLDSYLLAIIKLLIFFIAINFLISIIFPKQQHQRMLPSTTKHAVSLFIAFTIIISTNIDLTSTIPYLSFFREDTFAMLNNTRLIITDLFLLAYTLAFVGYFYFWSHDKIQALNNIHLDMIISITLKIIVGLLLFLLIWDELHNLMITWGDSRFIQDLTLKTQDQYLSYTSNAGISLTLYLVSLPLIVAITKLVPSRKYQYFHLTVLLILWSYVIYDGIDQTLSLRLMLFQSAVFLFITVLTITAIGAFYTFILDKILQQYADKT